MSNPILERMRIREIVSEFVKQVKKDVDCSDTQLVDDILKYGKDKYYEGIAYEEDRVQLSDEYEMEFIVIDGLNQHKDGLTFEQWMRLRK
jgi:hypothetical protein